MSRGAKERGGAEFYQVTNGAEAGAHLVPGNWSSEALYCPRPAPSHKNSNKCPQTTSEDTEGQRLRDSQGGPDGGGNRTQVSRTPEATPLTASFYSQCHCGAWTVGPAAGSPLGLAQRLPAGAPFFQRSPPPTSSHVSSPAALPRAPRPGGCGAPGSGRPVPRRRRTRAVVQSSRTTSEPGRVRGRATPARTPARTPAPAPAPARATAPAPHSPLTWPSARRRALHLSQVAARRGLPDPAPGPRRAPGTLAAALPPAGLLQPGGRPPTPRPHPGTDPARFSSLLDILLN